MRRQKQKTIIIEIKWHDDKTREYSVIQHADLCEILHGDTKEPWIYVKKRENPELEILINFQMNRPIEGLCFQAGNSEVLPVPHSEGSCGAGFLLVDKIDPHPKSGWWEATVENGAAVPENDDEYFILSIFPTGQSLIDPRVYNHGNLGNGFLRRLLAGLVRLFRLLFPRYRPQQESRGYHFSPRPSGARSKRFHSDQTAAATTSGSSSSSISSIFCPWCFRATST